MQRTLEVSGLPEPIDMNETWRSVLGREKRMPNNKMITYAATHGSAGVYKLRRRAMKPTLKTIVHCE